MLHHFGYLVRMSRSSFDGIRLVVGVHRVTATVLEIVRIYICNARHNLLSHIVQTDHKGVARIGSVDFKRGFVIQLPVRHIQSLIFQHQTVADTRNEHLVREIVVFRLLPFADHHGVQLFQFLRDVLLVSSGNVLDRLTRKLCALERDDLVRKVHNHLVIDIRIELLDPVEDRLNAALIFLKVLFLTTVARVDFHCLVQHFQHVAPCDLTLIRENLFTPVKLHRGHNECVIVRSGLFAAEFNALFFLFDHFCLILQIVTQCSHLTFVIVRDFHPRCFFSSHGNARVFRTRNVSTLGACTKEGMPCGEKNRKPRLPGIGQKNRTNQLPSDSQLVLSQTVIITQTP